MENERLPKQILQWSPMKVTEELERRNRQRNEKSRGLDDDLWANRKSGAWASKDGERYKTDLYIHITILCYLKENRFHLSSTFIHPTI